MKTSLIPSLLLVILTALTFWPVHSATFLLYDDPGHVTQNPLIQPPTLARLWYFWRYPFDRSPLPDMPSSIGQVKPPYQEIYSPLAFTTWGLLAYPAHLTAHSQPSGQGKTGQETTKTQSADSEEYPLNPAIYHSFSLGLHILNSLLVFALLRQFVKQEWAAVLGAALFALHPVQVEPVAWVTGMNNLLSAAFALVALILYLRKKDSSETPRWKETAYWGATFCFLLSVLSKPSSVTVPALALLLCWGLGEKKWRIRLLEMAPWAVIVLFIVAMNAVVAHGSDTGVKPMIWQRPFLVGDALAFYSGKLLFPWHLAPDYGRRPQWVTAQPLTYVIWLIPFGVYLAAWLWWKRAVLQEKEQGVARIALVSIGIFGVVLIPTSGIVSYYFHLISTVSDRYMYMALIGPSLFVAVAASYMVEWENRSRRSIASGCYVVGVATMALLSFRQTFFWRSDVPLWAHNIAVIPQCTIAHYQYGVALYNGHDYHAAALALEQGVKVSPESWLAEIALGNAYFQVSQPARAEAHFRRALEIWPNAVDAHLGLGVSLAQAGNVAAAIDQFKQGLQLQPDNPQLLAYLGLNLTEAGQYAAGIVYLRNALEHGFDPAKGHFYLGNALARSGSVPEAAKEWAVAVQLDSSNYEAFFDLGIVSAQAGNVPQALQFFEKATQLQPDYAPAQVQLGLLWQRQGQSEKAKAAFRAALRSEPNNSIALNALKTKKQ